MDIVNVQIINDAHISEKSYIREYQGVIADIGRMNAYVADSADILDGEGLYACAGYIDIHSHGGYGFDVMDATPQALDKIAEFHLDHGVTSFLATTLTTDFKSINRAVDVVRKYKALHKGILGVHLEGPFFTGQNRGAHPEDLLAAADGENIGFIIKNSDVIRLISVSPDLEGAGRLIRECVKRGIVVSGGHDNSVDTEIDEAIEAGMTNVTHLYCCSSGISRRDSPGKRIGLTQIGLLDERLWVEVIADGCHVPERLFELIYKCKGYKKICLVSDSIRAAGMPRGDYLLGSGPAGVEITVTGDVALLKGTNLYAGSITPLASMVEKLAGTGKIPLEHAVYMATQSPASSLRLNDRGSIECGKTADINLLDKAGKVKTTVANGKIMRDHMR